MESALLEREEVGGGEVGAGAFGEDPDALLFVADLTDGAVECGNGGFAVRAVNEDGTTQSHCFFVVKTIPADKEREGDILNQPRKGIYLRELFAVTLQCLGKSLPRRRISSSLFRTSDQHTHFLPPAGG